MSKTRVPRKPWWLYKEHETSYGHHKNGFGIYLCDGSDWWDDEECSTTAEKAKYAEHCKKMGFTEKECRQ